MAIADRYTAVYPRATPGGWRLIGWTGAPVWEPERQPPALLVPGTPVRFRAVRATGVVRVAGSAPAASQRVATGTVALRVVSPGPLTTVQDQGRPGHGHLGVPVSGALDQGSWQLANRLVGNPPTAAVLEATVAGPVLRLEGPVGSVRLVAVTGAQADIDVGGRAGAVNSPLTLAAGEELRIGRVTGGVRLYIAVAGGLQTEMVLGSQATDQLSGLGPAPLAAEQRLGLGQPVDGAPPVDVAPVRPRRQPVELRIFPGPRQDWFTDSAWAALTSASWEVRPESNRVGLRLDGPPLERAISGELPPEGVVTGSIQVPTSGAPVLFLADHPVTGGYPVVAVVAEADLDGAAQAGPGTVVTFHALTY